MALSTGVLQPALNEWSVVDLPFKVMVNILYNTKFPLRWGWVKYPSPNTPHHDPETCNPNIVFSLVSPRAFADDVARVMTAAAGTEAGMDRRVSFDEFIHLLEQAGPAGPLEGPDPKVPACSMNEYIYVYTYLRRIAVSNTTATLTASRSDTEESTY